MEYDYFNSQKGWIHLVFANEQDVYDLPSTVRVGYRTYLEYLLKKSGYEAIFFWDENNGQILLNFPDAESAECYDRLRPKKWSLFGRETSRPSQSVKVSPESIDSIIGTMGNADERIALVTDMGTFDSFFSDEAAIKRLKKTIGKQRTANSILVLTAGIMASESNIYLTKSGGVMQTLLEEVRQAVTSGGKFDLYTSLKKNMKERCIFLNDLSKERIKSTVSRNVLKLNIGENENYADSIDAVAEVIWKYYHSTEFREKFSDVLRLPRNERYELRKIDEYLRTPEFISSVKTLADDYQGGDRKNAGSRYEVLLSVGQSCTDDVNVCYIGDNDFVLGKWFDNSEAIRKMDSGDADELKKISGIDRRLKNIVLRGDILADAENDESTLKRNILYGIQSIENSASGWQRDYRRDKIYALSGYLEAVDGAGVTEEEWDLFETVFRAADSAQTLQKKARETGNNMKRYRKEFQEQKRLLDAAAEGTFEWERYSKDCKRINGSCFGLWELYKKQVGLEKNMRDVVGKAKLNIDQRATLNIGADDIKNIVNSLRDQEMKIKGEAFELSQHSVEYEEYLSGDGDLGDSGYYEFILAGDDADTASNDGSAFGDEMSDLGKGLSEEDISEWIKS